MLQEIIGIIGVVVGFFLYWIGDYVKNARLKTKYAKIIYFEFKNLQNELGKRLKTYDEMCSKTRDELGQDKENIKLPQYYNPYKFLLRLNFKPNYVYTHNNLEKISIFSSNTIREVIQIYSLLIEFEEYQKISIRNFDTNELSEIAMNDPEWLLIENLRKIQILIPNALISLKADCTLFLGHSKMKF